MLEIWLNWPTIWISYHGQEVEIARREEHFIAHTAGERLYSAILRQGARSREEMVAAVCGMLANGVVLNVGDGGHARFLKPLTSEVAASL